MLQGAWVVLRHKNRLFVEALTLTTRPYSLEVKQELSDVHEWWISVVFMSRIYQWWVMHSSGLLLCGGSLKSPKYPWQISVVYIRGVYKFFDECVWYCPVNWSLVLFVANTQVITYLSNQQFFAPIRIIALNYKKKTLFSFIFFFFFLIFERGSILFECLQASTLCPSVNISFGYENEYGAVVEVSTTLSPVSRGPARNRRCICVVWGQRLNILPCTICTMN